jgi:hypothetical protein
VTGLVGDAGAFPERIKGTEMWVGVDEADIAPRK